jgi:single-stranded-DNA-specific exonuclease
VQIQVEGLDGVLENGQGQGSARSIRHFEMHRALADCSEHLDTFGGHAMAAGLRIKAERIEAFTERFVDLANRTLTARDLDPTLRLDAEVSLRDLPDALDDVNHLLRQGMLEEIFQL